MVGAGAVRSVVELLRLSGTDSPFPPPGTGRRIATEIKLDKTLTESTHQFYRTVTPLPQNAFQSLSEDRARTWTLLFVAEIA
jgi:hypothetical protein